MIRAKLIWRTMACALCGAAAGTGVAQTRQALEAKPAGNSRLATPCIARSGPLRRLSLLAATLGALGLSITTPANAASSVTRPTIAVTFDDLPFAGEGRPASPSNLTVARTANRRILAALKRARIPAIGFVNESKVEAFGGSGRDMLRPWTNGTFELGNHGYAHADSNEQTVEEIEQEIIRGEATIGLLAAESGRPLRFFRFPYNHVGDTEPKRLAIEALLAKHKYRLAAATIDTSDYVYDRAYSRALEAGDRNMRQRIERAYLFHSRAQVAYSTALARQLYGREVPAILLLHLNQLNAATMPRLLRSLRSDGYEFVSLAQAQADPAYAKTPAVATRFGPMWGYRWARERGIEIDGSREPEPPAWIVNYGANPRQGQAATARATGPFK